MFIRKASIYDAPALTELALRSKRSWGYDDLFIARIMGDMVVRPDYLSREHGLVAEEHGSILGYAILRTESDQAVLRDLFIEPAYFNRGIGTKLFAACVEIARKNEMPKMTLESDPNATEFYERMGMRQTGFVPSNGGNGRNLPVMEMKL
jgi:N-acetylglutamate synthase-like GNAT family acetyltransferase